MSRFFRPFGLRQAVEAVEALCDNCIPYENTKVPPILMGLEAGNGQTTFTKYVAKRVIRHKIRQVVGLTTYLEFAVEGKMDPMQRMFGEIASAAKGVNHFEGVIAFDITELTGCIYEEQTEFFLDRLREIAKYAIILLYISPGKVKSAAKQQELKKKLQETFPNLQAVEVEPYTAAELSRMVLARLDDYGIDIPEEQLFADRLQQVVAGLRLSCAKETEGIAEMLAKQATGDRFCAELSVGDLAKAFPHIVQKGVAL